MKKNMKWILSLTVVLTMFFNFVMPLRAETFETENLKEGDVLKPGDTINFGSLNRTRVVLIYAEAFNMVDRATNDYSYNPYPNLSSSNVLPGASDTMPSDPDVVEWKIVYIKDFGETSSVRIFFLAVGTETNDDSESDSPVEHSNYAYVDMSGEINGQKNVPYLSTNFGESNSYTFYYNTSDKNWDGEVWTSKTTLKPGTYYIYAMVEELGNTTGTTEFVVKDTYKVPNTGVKE